jgi:hypothetical protein
MLIFSQLELLNHFGKLQSQESKLQRHAKESK